MSAKDQTEQELRAVRKQYLSWVHLEKIQWNRGLYYTIGFDYSFWLESCHSDARGDSQHCDSGSQQGSPGGLGLTQSPEIHAGLWPINLVEYSGDRRDGAHGPANKENRCEEQQLRQTKLFVLYSLRCYLQKQELEKKWKKWKGNGTLTFSRLFWLLMKTL